MGNRLRYLLMADARMCSSPCTSIRPWAINSISNIIAPDYIKNVSPVREPEYFRVVSFSYCVFYNKWPERIIANSMKNSRIWPDLALAETCP